MGAYNQKKLREKWTEYKLKCDGHMRQATEFSSKSETFVTGEVPAPIPYDIQGFCTYIGVSRQGWYKVYVHDEKHTYDRLIEQIEAECETSKRVAFETGVLPSKLAGLWMSPYGYREKIEETVRDGDRKPGERKNRMTTEDKRKLLAGLIGDEENSGS